MKKKVIVGIILTALLIAIGICVQAAEETTSSNTLLAISNETEETVTTGVKGYYYITNDDSNNTDFDVSTAIYTESENISLSLAHNGKYIHMKAMDAAGNIGEPAVAKIDIRTQVIIDLAGGTLNGDPNPELEPGLAGSTIDLGTPEKDGYTFTGWEATAGTINICSSRSDNYCYMEYK
jgi:hypothetical protein